MARALVEVAATGDVTTTVPAYLHSVVVSGAAITNDGAVEVRDGASGPVRLTLRSPAGGPTAVWSSGDPHGVLFSTAIHATLTGTGATASFEFS